MRLFTFTRVPMSLVLWTFVVVAMANLASAQHGDVWLRHDVVQAKIGLGVVDESGTTFTPDVRVLEVILTPDSLPFSPFEASAEDPGFLAAAGELPPSQPINLSVVSLKRWNGSGLDLVFGVAFDFDLSSGFSTEADGSLHEHPLFGLINVSLSPLLIPDGVYVGAFRVGAAGLGDSDLEHFVMLKDALVTSETDAEELTGLLEDFENGGPAAVFKGKDFTFFHQAYDFVAAAVPEPSGVFLGACSLMSVTMARRLR
jgi:hypothetical protein